MLGEAPPPPPRTYFGRDELTERIVGLTKNLAPIALVGPGGIGKTSIALTVLHHDRVKEWFGDNRRFIRCDQFPASRTHFLSRLSKVIGAGVNNPEDLTPLRPFLSSRDMILFLDNAESILDSQGTNAQEIYAMVEELSQFKNICLCITSRICTIPPTCASLDIPTLSMEAARDTFYRIYKNDSRQSDPVNSILEQLEFHPLSITLLATVAYHNKWDTDRLAKEWRTRRTGVLHTHHDTSLAATIELSLASPMFRGLGPDARELLGVVAFFPQGMDENNVDWLFPTISDRTKVLDSFCILSLTHRSNGFITMLAPLRDHLCPNDTTPSPLLHATKDRYFNRLLVDADPDKPGFDETRWIVSEDVNVEHLLDVFTSIDESSASVWDACACFMEHLYWHKRRLVVLGPKIERLSDDHRSKPQCLTKLARLFGSVGNFAEGKRLLAHTLGIWRERGEDFLVAQTLRHISNANRLLGFHKEGIEQVKEALGIYEWLDDVSGQARSWRWLAWLLYGDKQLEAAEEAASRAIDPLSDKGEHFPVCECYHLLGLICHSKGERENAIRHFETALRIASPFNWHDHLFWNHYSLSELFFSGGRFDDAHAHIERAKSHAINDPYLLGHAMYLRAQFWGDQCRLEEAKSDAVSAAEVFEKLGAAKNVECCREIIRDIEERMKRPATSGGSDFNGEPLETMQLPAPINLPFPVRVTEHHLITFQMRAKN